MGQEIYPALSGGLRSMRSLDMLANNLANVNTTGFKSDRAAFALEVPESAGDPGTAAYRLGASYVTTTETQTDYSQGTLQSTGNPTDLALLGEGGFFRLAGEEGSIELTRDGSFAVDTQGMLVAIDGARVIDVEGEPIKVGDAPPVIGADGTVTVDGEVRGRIAIVDVADRSILEKAGGNRWRVPADTELAEGTAHVRQGELEGSNVEPVRALTELIAITRYYEAFQKSLESSSDLDEQLSTRVGRVDS